MNTTQKPKGFVIAVGILLVAGAWIGAHWTWGTKTPEPVPPPVAALPYVNPTLQPPTVVAPKVEPHKSCADPSVRFEDYRDSTGQWRWRAQGANNRILAHGGESYHNQADLLGAMKLLFGSVTVYYVEARQESNDDDSGTNHAGRGWRR